MVFKTLEIIIGAQSQLFRFERGMLQQSVVSYTSLLILCSILCLVNCGPCLIDVLPKLTDYDVCGSCKNDDGYATDVVSDTILGETKTIYAEKDLSGDSESFCFPSTLNGFAAEEHKGEETTFNVEVGRSEASLHMKSTRLDGNASWSSGFGIFQLLNGISLSCSLGSQEASKDISLPKISDSDENCREHVMYQRDASFSFDRSMEIDKSTVEDCPLHHVDIMTERLDWGHKYLFYPSLAFLTLKNTCDKSLLNVYEPYSTDVQFYPCSFREYVLRPGENASLCFVFLPRRLGLSSAQLVLQTSSGGFLIEAIGFAAESPYKIQSLVGLDVSSGRWWSRNLSLFNPFDEAVYVEEVTAWIAISVGNNTLSAEAICKRENSPDSGKLSPFGANNWLNLKSGHNEHPDVAVRPLTGWVVRPKKTEAFMEIGFIANGSGKVLGSICLQLRRPLHDGMDTLMVPFEANLNERVSYDDGRLVSASVALIKPCDASKTASISISLRNHASYLLKIIKINEASENGKLLPINYSEGLLIFPGSVTEVAVVIYGPLNSESVDEIDSLDIKGNICLKILTNDSFNPLIEIPCWEMVRLCSLEKEEHFVGHENLSANIMTDHTGIVSLTSNSIRNSSPLFKAFEKGQADEYVLHNWRSQGTMSKPSVLDRQEVVFPMVLIGKHVSQLISVRNPSDQPVIMQLILNAVEVVHNCKVKDANLHLSSASSYVHKGSERPFRCGFTIAESAQTEAYVQPYGTATFGPILFHPWDRCEWRSSALIRNNLSGVESITLQGSGGSFSLILLEGSDDSKPVERMEFSLNWPYPLNNSASGCINIADAVNSCLRPLSKVLLALNTGDMRVEVKRIDVSGVECGLDGFLVHDCGSFSLDPGESKEFQISYHAGFSAPAIQRDLELILATGTLVIPMKATIPICVFGACWKTMLWSLVRKWSVVFLAALVMFLMFCTLGPQILTLGLSGFLIKARGSSIDVVNCAAQPQRIQQNQRNGNSQMKEIFAVSSKTHCLVSAVMGNELRPRARLHSANSVAPNQANCNEYFEPVTNSRTETTKTLQEDGPLLSVPVKSAAVEGFDKLDHDKHEQSGSAHLTVKTGKDRVRRRRRRKGGNNGALSGPSELSSSQSSNSTPSSPLSPGLTFTPRRISPESHGKERPNESRSPSNGMTGQLCDKGHGLEHVPKAKCLGPNISPKGSSKNGVASSSGQSSGISKTAGPSSPVLLPSVTFPGRSRFPSSTLCPSGLSPSSIALHARAPGSKLSSEETSEVEEKARLADKFTYNIWGNNFSGLDLMTGSSEASRSIYSTLGNDFHSFFLRGPHTIMKITRSRSVCDYEQG